MSTQTLNFTSQATLITAAWANAVDEGVFEEKQNVRLHGAAGNGSTDDTSAIQAAVTAAATTGGTVVFPKGNYKITSVITVPSSVRLVGTLSGTSIEAWNCVAFNIATGGAVVEFNGLNIMSKSAVGVADPKVNSGITVSGVSSVSTVNYVKFTNLYMQGWNKCIYGAYLWNSVIDNVTTVNCNYGIEFFGQSVNNSVVNSRIQANSGTYGIKTTKDGSTKGEGLMIANNLIYAPTGISSDGFLVMNLVNNIIDLCSTRAIDWTGVSASSVTANWIYCTGTSLTCFVMNDLGVATDMQNNIVGNRIEAAGTNCSGIYVGGNNRQVSIIGNSITTTGTAYGISHFGDQLSVIGNTFGGTNTKAVKVSGTKFKEWGNHNDSYEYNVSQINSVASAATISLPKTASNVFSITGTTNITSVNAADWEGQMVTLLFGGVLTFTDGSNLKLNGNFVTSGDDTITLICNSGNWYEVSRSAN